ncbi:uncharacterized protein LOC111777254 [Cucurbita pepo subsp. pepo]|uniref:uncharacterized protein LOC111777254 n=1 Tax=Cucurbita pepo subsp. pepo TaxID=3664 RepID=UPI000C9D2B05|nr:uncharacterized protein LOC111777254 [Cucurbita pepo subsp. pepo]
MGICISSDSVNVATAKLILTDGTLLEFSYPVKVSFLLHKHPATFICNSDDMDFDDAVYAVHDDDHLQLGHLYFALPLDRLNQPLHPEEMAALAVKASSALIKAGAGGTEKSGSRRTAVSPLAFSDEEFRKPPRRSLQKGSGGGRKFRAKLSAIPE